MDLLKSTSFITALLIIFTILALLCGIYREHLYREEGRKQQKEITSYQKEILGRQNILEANLNKLVEAGKLSKETAQKIIQSVVHSDVSVKEEVKVKVKVTSPHKSSQDD